LGLVCRAHSTTGRRAGCVTSQNRYPAPNKEVYRAWPHLVLTEVCVCAIVSKASVYIV
ncbi:hypothetical protein BaRGS_00038707, partial [Batillaria attramentaria]